MSQKHLQNIYHVNVNVNLMVENVTRIKCGIMINVDESANIQKKHNTCEKDYIWNPTTCSCKIFEYLTSTIDNSVITCDGIINSADSYKKWVSKFS